MHTGVIGINYKTSDLYLRELLAKACLRCFGLDKRDSIPFPCVLLTTCNRTEVYFSAPNLAEAHSVILQLLRLEIDCPFEHKLYSYFGIDCFMHLAKVTAGLDSVILAETEIQRQVKLAYENACLDFALPSCLHFMFQKCLKISKGIRTRIPLLGRVSLENVIFQLGQWMFDDMSRCRILFVGNSEINRKILHFFRKKNLEQITLCTRAPQNAKELPCPVVDWMQLPFWHRYDLVICGTHQNDYLMTPEHIPEGKEVFTQLICDLSVPRTVDPRLSHHPHIHLMNIEELGHLIEQKQDSRLKETLQSEEWIREAVDRQLFFFHQKEKKRLLCR